VEKITNPIEKRNMMR